MQPIGPNPLWILSNLHKPIVMQHYLVLLAPLDGRGTCQIRAVCSVGMGLAAVLGYYNALLV